MVRASMTSSVVTVAVLEVKLFLSSGLLTASSACTSRVQMRDERSTWGLIRGDLWLSWPWKWLQAGVRRHNTIYLEHCLKLRDTQSTRYSSCVSLSKLSVNWFDPFSRSTQNFTWHSLLFLWISARRWGWIEDLRWSSSVYHRSRSSPTLSTYLGTSGR